MTEVFRVEFLEDLSFDSMTVSDYENATGVKLAQVQNQAVQNVAQVAPPEEKGAGSYCLSSLEMP